MRASDPLSVLGDRVRRHPAGRYPVQHATAQFHLGQALADAGRLEEAASALRVSAAVFARAGLEPEAAKAANQLGAVLRVAGDPRAAIAPLLAAADTLEESGDAADEGAARYNLGLALREAGQLGAHAAFARAVTCLTAAGAMEHASAATREAGVESWRSGNRDAAIGELEQALDAARDAGAPAATGAAANVLGLVLLDAGRPQEARDALTDSVAAHPRAVRPEDHAMAQANLALAHEQTGDPLRARVAARHALGVSAAPPPVREQARAVLHRLSDPPGDLPRLLACEPFERWPSLVRAELTRLAEAAAAERDAEAAAWLQQQLACPEDADELAAGWLGALLELPPGQVDLLVASLLDALDELGEADAERVRRQFERGMARFHVPQMLRLRDTFAQLAAQGGHPGWS